MTVRPCYIHIGTHKTGTTSIQAFLRDNEQQLATRGVLIPKAGRGQDAAGHHNLTQELLTGPGFVAERGGLKEVADELGRSNSPRACISSEDFTLVSRSPAVLSALRDAIVAAGFKPVIVVYLRPQVPYCISIYSEIVKNGNLKPFDTYFAELMKHGTFVWNGSLGPLCRYDVLLDRFAAVFGEEAIVVRRYRSNAPKNALLISFARLVVGTAIAPQSFTFPHERFNPSMSFRDVLRALAMESAIPDMRFAPLDPGQSLRLAVSFLRSNCVVAIRFGTWIPPLELLDLLIAMPLRKTFARTSSLQAARRALREIRNTN